MLAHFVAMCCNKFLHVILISLLVNDMLGFQMVKYQLLYCKVV